MVNHASLTLKRLDKVIAARTSEKSLQRRKETVLKWKFDEAMDWHNNCIFIDEAGFNMHLRRNFGRSKRGIPAKAVVPTNRGTNVTIVGAICERGIIALTLRKPKAVQKKKRGSNKKRKREDGGPVNVPEINGIVGTRSEHFLQFIVGLMDTLDKHGMRGRYFIMDNAAIHKVPEVHGIILSRGYKVA